MTENHDPESAKVAALEARLAEAAAEVARVEAELSQARAADPNQPPGPVPYAGNAPMVMINGQQVSAETAAKVRGALEQLGLGQLGAMLVGGADVADQDKSWGSSHGHQVGYLAEPGAGLSPGNLALRWLAALVVLGLIALMIYLSVTS